MKLNKVVVLVLIAIVCTIIAVCIIINIKPSKESNEDLSSWKWPTDDRYSISLNYGYTGEDSTNWHSGIDISGLEIGDSVYAVADGIVSVIGVNEIYGTFILINHDGKYYTLYAHLSENVDLKAGEAVTRGQTIGKIGMTGATVAPHLHFEVRTCEEYSCAVNPLDFY